MKHKKLKVYEMTGEIILNLYQDVILYNLNVILPGRFLLSSI